jgi:hypothetical protein
LPSKSFADAHRVVVVVVVAAALRAFVVILLADDTRAQPFARLALKPVVAKPVIALCIADMFHRKQGTRPCRRLVCRFDVASSVASKADVVDPLLRILSKNASHDANIQASKRVCRYRATIDQDGNHTKNMTKV